MKILLVFLMVAAAHAATIQLTLDAFKLSPVGTKWAFQIKMLGKDGAVSPKSLKITNIKATNLKFAPGPQGNGERITGDAENGFTLFGEGGNGLFASDLLSLMMGDSGLPPSLTFDLEFEENGQKISADEFGLFLFESQPGFSVFSSQSSGGSFGINQFVSDPGGSQNPNLIPLIDPPPVTIELSGGTSSSGSSGASGSSGSSGSTNLPNVSDPSPVPEPSTFGLFLVPVVAMFLRRR